MEINRKTNLYQTATVLFILAFTSLENGVTGQCLENPENIAVLEGTENQLFRCTPNPTQVTWRCYPTSDELGDARINEEEGVISSDAQNLYKLSPDGLVILKATIYEESNLYSTAGICLALHGNETRLAGAKLIVVHNGPVCTLNVTSPANGDPVLLNCTASYADHSVHPVRPHFLIKVGDVVIVDETIIPVRIDQYIFVASKAVELAYNACASINVTLTFDPPTDIQYEFMATNAPKYTNTISIPASSTGCLRDAANVAVLEGSRNVLVGSSRSAKTLQRRFTSTSDQLADYPISDANGILPNMTEYYSQDNTGLIIKSASAVAPSNKLASAGIYTERDESGKLTGYKVIVVRAVLDTMVIAMMLAVLSRAGGPPTCTTSVGAPPPKHGDSIQLTCVAVYADHVLHPISPRLTYLREKVRINTSTPKPTRTAPADGTFTVTAVFTSTYNPGSDDVCEFSFDPPPTNDGYGYIVANTPNFISTCTFPPNNRAN